MVESWTDDQKVLGSIPGGSMGDFSLFMRNWMLVIEFYSEGELGDGKTGDGKGGDEKLVDIIWE